MDIVVLASPDCLQTLLQPLRNSLSHAHHQHSAQPAWQATAPLQQLGRHCNSWEYLPKKWIILRQQYECWRSYVWDVVGAARVSVVQVRRGIPKGLQRHCIIKACHRPAVQHGLRVCSTARRVWGSHDTRCNDWLHTAQPVVHTLRCAAFRSARSSARSVS